MGLRRVQAGLQAVHWKRDIPGEGRLKGLGLSP